MPVSRETIAFADFSGGEFGGLGAWAAPPNSFTGRNVVRYRDGSLGPRCALKAIPLTGIANGVLRGMGWNAFNSVVWFADSADAFKQFKASLTTSQAITAVAVINTLNVAATRYAVGVDAGNGDSYVVGGKEDLTGGVKQLDHSSPTVFAVDSSPSGGTAIALYGDRLMVAVGNRVWYSEAGSYGAGAASWPAGNFIDLPPGEEIGALLALRSSLAIVTQTGWWILTGVPGVNDVLRKQAYGYGTCEPTYIARALDDRIGVVPVYLIGTSANRVSVGTRPIEVAIFDGSVARPVREHQVGDTDDEYATSGFPVPHFWCHTLPRDDGWFVLAGSAVNVEGWLHQEGVWTRHEFGYLDAARTAWVAQVAESDLLVVGSDGVASVSPPTFNWLRSRTDHPPFATDAYAGVLAPSRCYFSTPEHWSRDGQEMAVRSVQVSFTKWDTDDADPNTFDVDVTAKRTYEGGDGTVVSTADAARGFSEATSASSATGTSARRTFNFEEHWGNAFQVKVKNMRGVSIAKIHVTVDSRPMAGV